MPDQRDDFVISEDALVALVSAIRAADEVFERVWLDGAHYVRDCLLPEFERRGLRVLVDAATRG